MVDGGQVRSVRFLVACLAAVSLALPVAAQTATTADWKAILHERIPLFGHRNWIVIADSAYPAQAANGIETLVSNADHFQVLQTVLGELERSKHVRPIVYLDQELQSIDEKDAVGIAAYRQQLSALLGQRTIKQEAHEQLMAKLGQLSQTFRVLIIKTDLALPYTSVFLQLDCAYWNADAEQRLRSNLSRHPRSHVAGN